MGSKIEELLEKLDLSASDACLFQKALTHSSYCSEYGGEDNERLEFLGDAVLSLMITEYIYLNCPDFAEGRLAKIKAYVVSERILAEIARTLEMGKHIMLGKGEAASGGMEKDSVLADAMEAVIGSIFLSRGYEKAVGILMPYFIQHINEGTRHPTKDDFKSSLQEILQGMKKSTPRYRVEEEKGPAHNKIFTVGVWCDDVKLGRGSGKNKKDASQKAAESAIIKLKNGFWKELP
ncbi:MAG: ribonuclease III [Bacillota bacterium]